MGHLEKQSRKRAGRNALRTIMLKTVAAGEVITVAMMARGVGVGMQKLGLTASSRQNEVVKRSTQRLVKLGFLQWKNQKLRLTARGERELRRLTLFDQINKSRRWDGKWRVLIFDIPEKRRGLRQQLTSLLRTIGFQRLQDSVWVYPYDCEDLMTLLKVDLHVGNDVLYMIADAIENDRSLREMFKI
jgi:DNA-binding transcriptional regulator PaaX